MGPWACQASSEWIADALAKTSRKEVTVKKESSSLEASWGSTLFEWTLNDICLSKVERESRRQIERDSFWKSICLSHQLWIHLNHLRFTFKHPRFHFNFNYRSKCSQSLQTNWLLIFDKSLWLFLVPRPLLRAIIISKRTSFSALRSLRQQ